MKKIPTLLSIFRIVITPLFVQFFLWGGVWLVPAVIIFTLAALTDACDGYIARRYKVTSVVGAFLDPIADKILIGTTFCCFVIKGLIGWWFVIVIMGRDLLVTILRILALRQGRQLVTTKDAKYKTIAQFVVIYAAFILCMIKTNDSSSTCTIIFEYFVRIIMYLTALFTIYTGINYVYAYMNVRKGL